MNNRWNAVNLPLIRRPLPRQGQVDLWLTDLEELPLDAGPSGLTRKERILKQRIQQRFVLRLLLGSYLGVPGKDIVVERDEFDKPRLAGVLAQRGLNFNLSHSGRWLAIALTLDKDIGVDVEHQRVMARAADLARRYFKGSDSAAIQALDEPERSQVFLHQWTAREALVKAQGCGLASAIGQIEMAMEPTTIQSLPDEWPQNLPQEWQLIEPEWPGEVVGHVAVPTDQTLTLNCHWLHTAPPA